MSIRPILELAICAALSGGLAHATEHAPWAGEHASPEPTLAVALAAADEMAATSAVAEVADPAASIGAPPARERRAQIVMRALSLLGVSYRFGGSRPETGLDCSGLVRVVFRDAAGIALPRRSAEISRTGDDVPIQKLRPGDLVFFNTLRRAFSHVGIYIGNDRFVHAPSSGGRVRVERIDRSYWQARFDGGRRLASVDPAELGEPYQAPIAASR